jgi:hypothetical protein
VAGGVAKTGAETNRVTKARPKAKRATSESGPYNALTTALWLWGVPGGGVGFLGDLSCKGAGEGIFGKMIGQAGADWVGPDVEADRFVFFRFAEYVVEEISLPEGRFV